MKTASRILCAIAVTAFLSSDMSVAQQWTGSTNNQGNLGRIGNVGIGREKPDTKLHVWGNSGLKLQSDSRPDNFMWIYPDGVINHFFSQNELHLTSRTSLFLETGTDLFFEVGRHLSIETVKDFSLTAGNDLSLTSVRDMSFHSGRDLWQVTERNSTSTVRNNRTDSVYTNFWNVVGNDLAYQIGHNYNVNAKASGWLTTGADFTLKTGNNVVVDAGNNATTTAKNNIWATAGKDVSLTAGKVMYNKAGTDMMIQTGRNLGIDVDGSMWVNVASTHSDPATGEEMEMMLHSNSYSVGQWVAADSEDTLNSVGTAFVFGSGANDSTWLINDTPNSMMIGFNSSKPTVFVGPASQPDGIGMVGIGTTTPGFQLDVNGTIFATDDVLGSDRRWKQNIGTIPNALNGIRQLRGVEFTYRGNEFPSMNFPVGPQVGLIAQDVEQVFPQVVRTNANGYKAVAYSKLVAVLVEGVKEQQNTIESQQAMIDNLMNMVQDLTTRVETLEANGPAAKDDKDLKDKASQSFVPQVNFR